MNFEDGLWSYDIDSIPVGCMGERRVMGVATVVTVLGEG